MIIIHNKLERTLMPICLLVLGYHTNPWLYPKLIQIIMPYVSKEIMKSEYDNIMPV